MLVDWLITQEIKLEIKTDLQAEFSKKELFGVGNANDLANKILDSAPPVVSSTSGGGLFESELVDFFTNGSYFGILLKNIVFN